MRILLITLDFQPNLPGGAGIFQHNLCLAMHQLGHLIDVLCPFKPGWVDLDAKLPYRVFRFPIRKRFSSLSPTIKAFTLHRYNQYHVILLGHFTTTHALGALILNKAKRVPVSTLCHGSDLSFSIRTWIDRVMANQLLHSASLMLANSKFTADRVRKSGYRGSIEIIHPGVDVERFRPGLDTTEVLLKYGLDSHQTLLTVGRIEARKNVQGVLHALPQVVKQVPNLLYLIVGESYCHVGDGNERELLEKQSEKLGLRPYVHFLGHVEDDLLPALYCASDLFIMPSFEQKGGKDYEGFGIVFSEANACGKPVIGGRSGGIEDAVIDGETGLLVDPHDVDAIAEAIIRLLTDKALAQRLGQNGRRRVEQELTWKKVGDRLEGYLKQVQKKR